MIKNVNSKFLRNSLRRWFWMARQAYIKTLGLSLLTAAFMLPISIAQGTDLIISPEFVIAPEVRDGNSDTQNPGKPGIGFDGENYLVVTCREGDTTANIKGILMSPNATSYFSFPIADITRPGYFPCSGQKPAVAFDGENYLVVFSRITEFGYSSVMGTRVTPSGTVLDGPVGFTIFDYASPAAVAFDGSNYLVVTDRYSNDTLQDIIGVNVTPAGLVLDEFPVFTETGGQIQASVAFDGINYLVVWSDTRSGSPVGPDADIYGTRVTPAGVVLDPQGIPISTAAGIQEYPVVIFDGNNYFTVWEDTRSNPGSFPPALDIYGTRITPNGIVLDGPTDSGGIAINTHPRPQQHPAVSFNGEDYLVTWDVSFYYDPPVGVYAARVSTEGSLLDGPPDAEGILVSQPTCFACRHVWPNILYSGDNFLLSWLSNREGDKKDIVGVLIYSPPDQPGPSPLFNAQEYFPLHPGNQATYLVNESVSHTATVPDYTVNVNGVPTRPIPVFPDVTEYYTNDENGFRIHRSDFSGGENGVYSPPFTITAPEFIVGQTFETNGIDRRTLPGLGVFNLDYSATTRIEAVEQVSVPLGTFTAIRANVTVRETGDILGTPIDATATTMIWLTQHYGPVRRFFSDQYSGSLDGKLVSVSIDTDGDGVNVTDDNCPTISNPLQTNSDIDGNGDACDNCTLIANKDQRDTDTDNIGNMCDCDFNQDNFCGGPDFTMFIGCFNALTGGDPLCESTDMNGDGFVGGPDFTQFIGGFNGPPGPSGLVP